MPFVNVKVFEDRLSDPDFAGKLTFALTEAVVSVCGENVRENTWVIIDGVPREQWSFGGERKR
jgi:4-oxalocrotonate tautomerase